MCKANEEKKTETQRKEWKERKNVRFSMNREGKLPFVIVFVYSVYWSSKSFSDFPLAPSILLLIVLQHRQICFFSRARCVCVCCVPHCNVDAFIHRQWYVCVFLLFIPSPFFNFLDAFRLPHFNSLSHGRLCAVVRFVCFIFRSEKFV